MIAVVGLSHKTAPIALRERVALDTLAVAEILASVHDHAHIGELMILSTCNRTELLAAGPDGSSVSSLCESLREFVIRRTPESDQHLYRYVGNDAVNHVFHVVSSLDSLVVGEPQILGQFKDAFELARRHGTVGTELNRVVSRALRTAKRVRNETQVGTGQVSIPTVALDLARQIFGDMGGHTVALLGTGDMGELVARLLRQSGASLLIVGRNSERVRELTERYGADGMDFDSLELAMTQADVVVTSTSSPTAIVDGVLVKKVMRKRRGRDLFFVDVAVPRDVSPEVDALDGVYRYDVDDLAAVVARSLGSREKEAGRAEQIVIEEVTRFERWAESEQVTPLVCALRQHFQTTLQRELGRSLRTRLKHLGDSDRVHLERMIDAAVNKMMHDPTIQLRKMAARNSEDVEQATALLDELFSLSTTSEDSAIEVSDDGDSVDGSRSTPVRKENLA